MKCSKAGNNEEGFANHTVRPRCEKARKRGKELEKLRKVVKHIANGKALQQKYRDHALTGQWRPARDCHIEPDWILIYTIDKSTLRLERTGTHSDLFNK